MVTYFRTVTAGQVDNNLDSLAQKVGTGYVKIQLNRHGNDKMISRQTYSQYKRAY